MKKHLLLLSLVAATISTTSFAGHGHGGQGNAGTERILVTIPMDGQQVLSGQTTIALKRKIKQQRPGLDLSKADLKRVTLKAKSAAGHGSVYVTEGHFQSRQKTIDKSPRPQGFRKRGGFSEITLRTPREMKQVAWKMQLRGKIKAKSIVVAFDMPKRQGMKSAQCTVKLQTIFGQSWESFNAQAKGQNKRRAKVKACNKAMRQCQVRLDAISAFIPQANNIVNCVTQ